MPLIRRRQTLATAALACGLVAWSASTVFAQLDPLGFLKRVPPTVIIAVDTSNRMLEDGDGYYYDPHTYTVTDDVPPATAMGVASVTNYRRKVQGLLYESNQDASTKFEGQTIVAVPDTAAEYATFWDKTRFEIAKKGVARAVGQNAGAEYRWGLVKLRQNNEAWRTGNSCDKPLRITNNAALQATNDSSPCSAGGASKYAIYVPTVTTPNFNNTSAPGDSVVVAAGGSTASSITTTVNKPILDATGLIVASAGTRNYQDRPLDFLLNDAKTQVTTAMGADASDTRTCRNSIVVLVAGGKDDGDNNYLSGHNIATTASGFQSVTAGGVTKRVPIYVVAIKPDPAHEAQLQSIATNSGGRYYNVSDVDAVARVINLAVQTGFARAAEFDSVTSSEFLPVSPIIGTVNLKLAKSSTGSTLPNTDISTIPGGLPIPQRSNMLLTAGFALGGPTPAGYGTSPGFEGRLRAFRVYRPELDNTKPSGWKFVKDGTPLWPNVDARPETAGLARLPADPNTRNIFTYVPGNGVVAFTTANAGIIEPHLGGATGATLIPFVRGLPLGPIIGSTPALMDPPSLDPPPDEAYGHSDAPTTYAGAHKDRRSIIWVGANDGMIHGIDARTGFEVWAFIPFNILPKLRTLMDGHPVEQFDYFVDSSPKIAEVKVNGAWKSLLIIGQGPGGIVYQTFDVTEAGMGGPAPDSDDHAAVLSSFNSTTRVQYLWSFPRYDQFDSTYYAEFTVTDGTSGGKVKMYGDLKSTASLAEKSVGFTWSDPAVGALVQDRSINAVIVGSGYFPAIEDQIPSRGATAPRAGRSFYLLNVADGTLIGNASGGACSGTGCLDVGTVSGLAKNALQADPTAAGDTGSYVVKKAYMGDLDGRYWRFDVTSTGTITKTLMLDTNGPPIYSSSALLFVGTSDVYMFFSTGSDLLPTTIANSTGTFKLYGLKDNYPGAGATVRFTQNLSAVTNSSGLATGERPSTAPSVAGDIVFFTTTTETASTPCADFSAKLYGLTYLGGAAYDTNNSGSITKNESPIIKTVAGRATAPFIVDQHLYFGSAGAGGANVEAFGDPEDFNNGVGQVGVRLLSWREVR